MVEKVSECIGLFIVFGFIIGEVFIGILLVIFVVVYGSFNIFLFGVNFGWIAGMVVILVICYWIYV